MSVETRRDFLSSVGKLVVGTVAFGSIVAHAEDEHAHMHGVSDEGLTIDAAARNKCGTCQFWGGMRKISDSKTVVFTQSMGWCNNPDSPNFQKLTAADHEMKKPGVWTKWPAL